MFSTCIKKCILCLLILETCHSIVKNRHSMREYQDILKPELLSSESISNWSVFSWNADFWHNLIRDELNYVYYSHTSSVFPYYDSVVASNFPNFQGEYNLGNFSRQESIFHLSSNAKSNVSFYYSGNVRLPAFDNLVSSINLNSIIDAELTAKITALVWMGNENVSAAPHYDSVNNIYIQLYGEKRFILQAPSYVCALEVYGRFHPYACQTRIQNLSCSFNSCSKYHRKFSVFDLSNIDEINDNCMNSQNIMYDGYQKLEFVLHPGDILYIPAFWFHETKSLSSSASISLWWDSPVLEIMDDIYSIPLPLKEEWPDQVKYCAVIKLIDLLLFELDSSNQSDFSYFIKQLLSNRYSEDIQRLKEKIVVFTSCRYCTNECSRIYDDAMLQYMTRGRSYYWPKRMVEVFLKILDLYGVDTDNGQAILSIKVSDYIEDMIAYISSDVPPAHAIVFWSATNF